jgi:flagellar protein FlaJ
VAIIVMTYVTLLGVMAILQTQFIDVMGDLVSQSDGGGSAGGAGFGGGGGVDPDVLSMLFFHAVTIQAILSGFISGYIRDAELISGVKYAVVLMTLALGVWIYVG